jgi:hypothetical protein
MSTSSHFLAQAYFRRNGLNVSSTECDTLGAFFQGLVDYGLLSIMAEGWIHRSAYNKGSGSTISAGLLGKSNMTLVASPTWGTSGLTFNGSTQYGTAVIPKGLTAGSLVVVHNGASTGQVTAFAEIGSIVHTLGRSNASGGGFCNMYYNSTNGPMGADCFNGSASSDQKFATPNYIPKFSGFRMHTSAMDGTAVASPANSIWSDATIASHATPRAITNACTMVTNAAAYDNPGYSLFYTGTIAMSFVFSAALTQAQVNGLNLLIRRTVASGLQWNNLFIVEGDSQAAGNLTDPNKWSSYVTETVDVAWYGKAVRTIQAVGGQTATQRLSAYSSSTGLFKPVSPMDYRPLVFLLEGTNDLINGVPSPQVWSDISAHLSLMKQDAFKIIMCTIPANQGLSVAQEAERLKLNNFIRNNPGYYDYLIDAGLYWSTWNATDFGDQVHLNAVGAPKLANLVLAAVPTPFIA